MQINGKQVETIVKEHEYLGHIFFIEIGTRMMHLSQLQLMLETLPGNSNFEYCGEMASYEFWLNVYEKSIFK